ncbi:MAG: zinc-ribbon domain-containing protein [Candidatus Hodarchaeales archaeon]|jgi:uncharacterized membrane protein HdeD (DUF308 family)
MSLKVCPNCGDYVKPDELFCQSCGTALSKSTTASTQQGHSTTSYHPSSPTSVTQKSIEEAKSYIQIIGTIEIVFGILAIFIGLLMGLIAFFVPALILTDSSTGTEDQEIVAAFLFILLFVFAILFLIHGIIQIYFGNALMKYKKSGRTVTMINGAIHLVNMPIGTAFGVFALFVLTKPEVEQLFN